MAPPKLPPNCSSSTGTFGVPDVSKKFRASQALLRPYAYAVPCTAFVPDFTPTLTIAPGFQPYSAPGFCCVLNSSIASIGSIAPASPAAMPAFIMLCAIQGWLLLIPSTMKYLSGGRPPLVLFVQPELPGYLETPGRRS